MWGEIRRPPLGGHQAARRMLPSACPKSFQSFKSQVDSQVFHSFFQSFKSQVDSQVFHSFPVLQSAISSLPIWYQLLAVCWLTFSCSAISCLAYPLFFFPLDPTMWRVTLTLVWCLNPGSPRAPLKNHHISSLSPGPLKIRKSGPRVTKRHQNVT